MKRWVEHYLEVYGTENKVTEAALNAIPQLTVMKELDAEPTLDELAKAINCLINGKAPGSDGIPPESLKGGKPVIFEHLHKLLKLSWSEKAFPQDMCDSNTINLYKNKGDHSNCNNYQGISLSMSVGKVYAQVMLNRLQILATHIYPEPQYSFIAGRSTVDMVFSFKQLEEKCREQCKPLYIAFIDPTKAFDFVSRDGLFKILKKIGCTPTLLSIISSFHENTHGTMSFDCTSCQPLKDHQWSKTRMHPSTHTVSNLLFHTPTVCLPRFPKQCFPAHQIWWQTVQFGKIKSKDKSQNNPDLWAAVCKWCCIGKPHCRWASGLLNRFSNACKEFGLMISIKKTKVIGQDVDNAPNVMIDGTPWDVVNSFTYLGATITINLSLHEEITTGIDKTLVTMLRLSKQVWENRKLTLATKICIYRACILSTLLYSSETWTTYAHHEASLNSFHLHCLRHILGITWKDKISNTKVLQQTWTQSMCNLLMQCHMHWLGHVRHMDDGRIPKDILYGELTTGSWPKGHPSVRFKDVCKHDLKACHINTGNWEQAASDHAVLRGMTKTGTKLTEIRTETTQQKRQQQKRVWQNLTPS